MSKPRVVVFAGKKSLEVACRQLGNEYDLTLYDLPLFVSFTEYDIVLAELMLPMIPPADPPRASGYNPSARLPYGFVIAWRAVREGVKYVAVVSDGETYVDRMQSALSHIATPGGPMLLGNTRVVFAEQDRCCDKAERDWLSVLELLTKTEPHDYSWGRHKGG